MRHQTLNHAVSSLPITIPNDMTSGISGVFRTQVSLCDEPF